MREIKIKKEDRDTWLSLLQSIPVRRTAGSRIGRYYNTSDMFDKFGNGDGDDENLCEVAQQILFVFEKHGVSVSCMSGIHNNYAIDEMSWSGGVWRLYDLDIDLYEIDSDDGWLKLIMSLPPPAFDALVELAFKGVVMCD